jgi:hypothetical protein
MDAAQGAGLDPKESLATEKVYEDTVNIVNVIHHCTAPEKYLLDELHSKFVGRCHEGAVITRILRVIGRSACRIVGTNCSGEGFVDVRFLAAVRQFCRGDIITGVVIRITTPVLAGHYDFPGAQAFVVLVPSRGAEVLAEGLRVPVRIAKAEHAPRSQAVMTAVLLTCDTAAPVFRVRGVLDPASAAEMMPMVTRIEHELVARDTLLKNRAGFPASLAFFEALLYAYRRPKGASRPALAQAPVVAWAGGPEWQGPEPLAAPPAGYTLRSVPELVRAAAAGTAAPVAGLWARPLCVYRSSPLVAFAERGGADAEDAPIDEPPRVVFAQYLKDMLDSLIATRELATDHASPETDEKYAGLWGAMRAAQTAL